MSTPKEYMTKLVGFIHHNFIWLLLFSYLLAAVMPGPGLFIRSINFGQINLFGDSTTVTLPMLMLGFLLLNGGLGTDTSQVARIFKKPALLTVGIVANAIIPIALIFLVNLLFGWWHNIDERESILAGLTLIASMPIAGSSTAWSQNANGNLALSCGLVLLSTILSPFVTPFALKATSPVLSGDYSEDLQELAGHGTKAFLGVSVILPVVLGLLLRLLFGKNKVELMRPCLKLLNFIVLLILNYSNAATTLPQTFRQPDADFLAATTVILIAFTFVSFAAGWLAATLFRAERPSKVSLMFGLGMNNNGTALVLANTTMSDHPMVLLQVILYTLLQNLAAGVIDYFYCRREQI
jgi:BASS family bile acid:Na+ symporter